MNILQKIVLMVFLVVLTAWDVPVKAQQGSEGKNVYRVKAYKAGDKTIESVSNTVEIAPGISLYIPNAFTPNSDNLNDTFGAAGEGIVEYHMQIFDRWGALVFETKDIKVQWDGTYNGITGEQDAYVYKISARAENYKRIYKTGSVMLLN